MAVRLEQAPVQIVEDGVRHRYPGRLIHTFFQVIHDRKESETVVLRLHISHGTIAAFDVEKEPQ